MAISSHWCRIGRNACHFGYIFGSGWYPLDVSANVQFVHPLQQMVEMSEEPAEESKLAAVQVPTPAPCFQAQRSGPQSCSRHGERSVC